MSPALTPEVYASLAVVLPLRGEKLTYQLANLGIVD